MSFQTLLGHRQAFVAPVTLFFFCIPHQKKWGGGSYNYLYLDSRIVRGTWRRFCRTFSVMPCPLYRCIPAVPGGTLGSRSQSPFGRPGTKSFSACQQDVRRVSCGPLTPHVTLPLSAPLILSGAHIPAHGKAGCALRNAQCQPHGARGYPGSARCYTHHAKHPHKHAGQRCTQPRPTCLLPVWAFYTNLVKSPDASPDAFRVSSRPEVRVFGYLRGEAPQGRKGHGKADPFMRRWIVAHSTAPAWGQWVSDRPDPRST
mmetsp:Transcript_57162/g.102149  ORF Transcript_57162/g.102149 Transcript_57162/m.102149 type:complete len:258 (-) Transcript_57162:247-1020(-)